MKPTPLIDSNTRTMRPFSDFLLGMSFAATWTWAVSVLVGMAILREQGVIPFGMWFVANIAAIPFFGWASRRWPDLWNQTRRLPMRVIMTVILIFTFWINMTGITTMGDQLKWFSHDVNVVIALSTGVAMWLAVAFAGIRWSVISDRVQWWALYGAVIVALVITLVEHGPTIDSTLQWGSIGGSWRAVALSLWTIPLLLSNPFIDGTFWHRAAFARSMRPYWYGFALFATYLCFVGALGITGPTPTALSVLYVVVFFAANSTMDSSASALQLTAGRRLGIGLGAVMLIGWLPISALGLLDAWLAFFAWFPILFAWQIVTLILERRGKLARPDRDTLAARDAVPLAFGPQAVRDQDTTQPITRPV